MIKAKRANWIAKQSDRRILKRAKEKVNEAIEKAAECGHMSLTAAGTENFYKLDLWRNIMLVKDDLIRIGYKVEEIDKEVVKVSWGDE